MTSEARRCTMGSGGPTVWLRLPSVVPPHNRPTGGESGNVNPIAEAKMSELGSYFRSQAEWRESKAEEYPDDPRNAQSAEALKSLAEYVESEEGEFAATKQLDALEPHLFEGFTFGGERAQRVVSRYGYGYRAVSPLQHLELLEELAVACLEDAYEFAGEHGDDPTETLFPFEVEAAQAGVFIPSRYFDRRSHSTEPELEEAVASFRAAQAEGVE
jgi:hypothetical protein